MPTMKLVACFALAVLTIFGTAEARAEETSHLVFVTEYIRELSATEDARAAAEKDLAAASNQNEKLSDAIHSSTLIQLELRSQIGMLKPMHLAPPFDAIVPDIVSIDQQKIELHQTMIDIASAFLVGPKPGVDYGSMATQMPKIRALLEDMDHTLFKLAPLIFATLIDQHPDSQNHMSHLIITKSERDELVRDITTSFGAKLDQKDQDYTISAASVLKAYLLKDYKCADERSQ